MAMRQSAGRAPAIRPRQSNHPVYEDFQPRTETKDEEAARIIFFHLPGFVKEQIRITSEHASGNIRVHGQRSLGNYKWSRFNKLEPVPHNCNVNKIHAKFHNGILTITMPKEVTTMPLRPKEVAAKPTPEAPSTSKAAATEPTSQQRHDKIPAKAAVPEPKPQKSHEEIHQTGILTTKKDEKQRDEKKISDASSQKGFPEPKAQKSHEEIHPTVDLLTKKDEIQKDEKMGHALSPQKAISAPKEQKGLQMVALPKQRDIDDSQKLGTSKPKLHEGRHEEVSSKQIDEKTEDNKYRKDANKKFGEPEKIEKAAEKALQKEKESTLKGKESLGQTEVVAVPKISEKEENELSEEEHLATSTNGKGMKSGTETAKQAMNNVVKGLKDEDKQFLINMGAAALVLVAFGAYVSYNYFGSSGKNKN
ncbi:hypothetical protein UlMin_025283 [Ulmus minor]